MKALQNNICNKVYSFRQNWDNQGCASHPQPGGRFPPDLAIFENWGGGGGEIFSKIICFI